MNGIMSDDRGCPCCGCVMRDEEGQKAWTVLLARETFWESLFGRRRGFIIKRSQLLAVTLWTMLKGVKLREMATN